MERFSRSIRIFIDALSLKAVGVGQEREERVALKSRSPRGRSQSNIGLPGGKQGIALLSANEV